LRKKIELAVLLLLIAGLAILSKNLERYVSSDKVEVKENTVVIDSGHGGADPGKIGVNDVLEKHVNLKIAKKVEKYLKKKDIKVVMTRKKDESLASDPQGSQKVQDLKKRVEIINDTAPELAVSIHQNSYHDQEIHGAQVFYYSHSEEGKKAAEIMQEALLAADSENTRQAKANDTYYLLKQTQVPLIIIECGFLSNPGEAEKLSDPAYQDEVAKAVAEGIIACLDN